MVGPFPRFFRGGFVFGSALRPWVVWPGGSGVGAPDNPGARQRREDLPPTRSCHSDGRPDLRAPRRGGLTLLLIGLCPRALCGGFVCWCALRPWALWCWGPREIRGPGAPGKKRKRHATPPGVLFFVFACATGSRISLVPQHQISTDEAPPKRRNRRDRPAEINAPNKPTAGTSGLWGKSETSAEMGELGYGDAFFPGLASSGGVSGFSGGAHFVSGALRSHQACVEPL